MIGGHRPGKHGRGADGKTVVLGMKQRGQTVKALVIPDSKATTVQPLIDKHVSPDSVIYTDEWWGYRLVVKAGYGHRRVHHGSKWHAYDDVHVNSMENLWARLKLSIQGTHVHVSKKHLPKHLGEFAFRYNHRDVADQMFVRVIGATA